MYENNTHTVPNRIVSISQPYIRPIVYGKVAAPVEFGEQNSICFKTICKTPHLQSRGFTCILKSEKKSMATGVTAHKRSPRLISFSTIIIYRGSVFIDFCSHIQLLLRNIHLASVIVNINFFYFHNSIIINMRI